jgi:hypothetical protein
MAGITKIDKAMELITTAAAAENPLINAGQNRGRNEFQWSKSTK